jgi:hypothetical protein
LAIELVVALLPVPVADVPATNGLAARTPEYSVARRST